MHIVFVVPSYASDESSGLPALRALVRELSNHVTLDVLALEHPQVQATWWDGPARIHALGAGDDRARDRIRRAVEYLARMHRAERIDLFHGLWLFEPGLVATFAARLLLRPSIASIGGAEVAAIPHLGYGGLLSRRGRIVARQVMRSASLVTGGSDWVCRLALQLSPQMPPDRLVRVPLPVDSETFRFQPRDAASRRSAPTLLQVGSYIPVKGHRTTIEAFASIAQHVPGSRLIMAGEDPVGEKVKLDGLVRQRGLQGCVEMLGRVSQRELAELHRQSDIFVFPSWHESQGIAALEAAASGIPIIGSNVGIVSDLAPQGAMTVEPGNAAQLSAAILNLWREPELAERMTSNAGQWVSRFATPEQSARRFVDLYRRMTSGR